MPINDALEMLVKNFDPMIIVRSNGALKVKVRTCLSRVLAESKRKEEKNVGRVTGNL
jgi:hypothetical protein